jgi:hypothetical protein
MQNPLCRAGAAADPRFDGRVARYALCRRARTFPRGLRQESLEKEEVNVDEKTETFIGA